MDNRSLEITKRQRELVNELIKSFDELGKLNNHTFRTYIGNDKETNTNFTFDFNKVEEVVTKADNEKGKKWEDNNETF